MELGEDFGKWSEELARNEDYGIWNTDEDYKELHWNDNADLIVPGPASDSQVEGVNPSGDEKKFSIADFKGKFFVLIFYRGDQESKSFVQAFSELAELFRGQKIEMAAISKDYPSDHTSSWSGSCKIPLWTDHDGHYATKFDMWDNGGFCKDGVVIIDEAGLVRHAVTSSIEPKEMVKNILDTVMILKKSKVDSRDLPSNKAGSSRSGGRAVSPVRLDMNDLEKDWDVSEDPELQKVLNKARMLGQSKPVRIQVLSKNPVFDLTPDAIRKNLKNPKRGAPVRWCSATVHRNLTGFGQSGDIPKDQKIKLENLMKKVMGVAYMPEDLTGKYTSLSTMNQREQVKFLENELFAMSGDSWMKEPGAVEWTQGKGVFINNYSNFILWVGLDDQIRMVSLAKGTDLKYVLLRLQKALSRIEEALKMVFSTKSCNERGFTTSNGAFVHSKRGVYGTGFETTFTIDLPGFGKADKMELEKAKNELFVDIEKGRSGTLHTVTCRQSIEDSETDIVTKSVDAMDSLYLMDRGLQAKLGIKVDQSGRSL